MVAAWVSAAMMLDWVGSRKANGELVEAAEESSSALGEVLKDGPRTRDIGGEAGTEEVIIALLGVLSRGKGGV